MQHSPEAIRLFFARSDFLDRLVLRPLSHIASSWETTWDSENNCYEQEADSFAGDLNWLIGEIAICPRPERYHDSEDAIVRLLDEARWPEQDPKGRWLTADYPNLLEQAAFRDLEQRNLIAAAAGRVQAALDHGQPAFDTMEWGHARILAAVMTIALYHRDNDGVSLRYEEPSEA